MLIFYLNFERRKGRHNQKILENSRFGKYVLYVFNREQKINSNNNKWRRKIDNFIIVYHYSELAKIFYHMEKNSFIICYSSKQILTN